MRPLDGRNGGVRRGGRAAARWWPYAEAVPRAADVIGTKVASMEFDSGVPGSGQVLEAWRVGKRIFVRGDEIGAFAVSENLNELLAWWIDAWQYADINIVGLKASLIKALGLARSDTDSWVEGSVRINGGMWRRLAVSANQ
jgi:hypothetical protein